MNKNKIETLMLLFILLISGCGVSYLLPNKAFSNNENRPLKQRPELNTHSFFSGNFQKEYEEYLSDQFIGRDFSHRLKMKIDLLMGKHQFDDVIIGKNDMLFQEYSPISKDDIVKRVDCINKMVNNYSSLHYSMLLVPNKIALYEEYLPEYYPLSLEEENMTEFLDLIDPKIKKSDVFSLLKENKDQDLFYKSDHHWTTKGAYLVFRQWLNDQGLKEKENYQSFLANDHFIGTLANRSGYTEIADQIDIYLPKDSKIKYTVHFVEENNTSTSLYDSTKQQSNDPYAVFLGGNHPLINISTNVENRKHLLLFKDSYANCMIQFLLPYYSEITIVDPRYYYDDIETLIHDRQISDVLFLYNANTFFHDDSLIEILKDFR